MELAWWLLAEKQKVAGSDHGRVHEVFPVNAAGPRCKLEKTLKIGHNLALLTCLAPICIFVLNTVLTKHFNVVRSFGKENPSAGIDLLVISVK